MADGEMMIGVGSWTDLSTDARAVLVFRPVLRRHADSLLRSQSFGSRVTRTMWKAACFIKDESGNRMTRETILYISEHAASSDSVIVELEAQGYEVVSTDSSTQGVALLYIMHSVTAVALHCLAEDRTCFNLAQSLRAIRPGVPIILLSPLPIDCLPSWVDACVVTEQPLEKVASTVHSLLSGEHFEVHSAQC